MQETGIPALVGKDLRCHEATKRLIIFTFPLNAELSPGSSPNPQVSCLKRHRPAFTNPQLLSLCSRAHSHNYWAHVPQLLKPRHSRVCALQQESHCSEKPPAAAAAAAAAKSLQSCPTLCDPIDGSPPGSPVPGILQGRTLEWITISFSSACKWKVKVKLLSRVPLSDPMDCSLPGSAIHGIF